ncbi:MAG: VWA domain-containing protein, partial [Methanosarcinales archaeon]|nr:VWA domain-containing protein [Methanosarcinales archaeon]
SPDTTNQTIHQLRDNLERTYGVRIFDGSVYAARIPKQHAREFDDVDSTKIVRFMHTHLPRSKLDGVTHAYIIADDDHLAVDPKKLFDDIYSAKAGDTGEPARKKSISEVEGVGAVGGPKVAGVVEVVEVVGCTNGVAEVDTIKNIEDIDISDTDSVLKTIESTIESEEQEETERIQRKVKKDETEDPDEQKGIAAEEEIEEVAPSHRVIADDAEQGIHVILDHFARKRQKKISSGKLTSGRRAEVLTLSKRGRYVRYRVPGSNEKPSDIALAPTVRAAAMHTDGKDFVIRQSDIREKVRRRRVATLISVVFDASGSMNDLKKTSVTKNVVLALLRDAYQRRDRVSLVTYSGRSAEVVLPFTSSVELARKYIDHIPFGSTTPLASGLLLGLRVLQAENKKEPSAIPILALITDGTANMPMDVGGNIEREISNICRLLGTGHINVLVIDISEDGADLASNIANACNGRYYHPSQMSQQALYNAIKCEQESAMDVRGEVF